MADASKLKNRSRKNLGSPPGPEEVATSLNSPEVAPVAVVPDAAEQTVPVPPASSVPETTTTPATTQVSNSAPYIRRDGRSARKTYRIIPFATRVTPEFDNEIRDIAEREGIKLVEVLENALIAYKAQKGY
ncbi:hypothetical protein QLI02_004238 [Salmonella enterica]|nr:hypothetical protein [Salmonella enterica]